MSNTGDGEVELQKQRRQQQQQQQQASNIKPSTLRPDPVITTTCGATTSPLTRFHTSVLHSIDNSETRRRQPPPQPPQGLVAVPPPSASQPNKTELTTATVSTTNRNMATTGRKRSLGTMLQQSSSSQEEQQGGGEPVQDETSSHNKKSKSFLPSSPSAAASAAASAFSSASRLLFSSSNSGSGAASPSTTTAPFRTMTTNPNTNRRTTTRRRSSLFGDLNSSSNFSRSGFADRKTRSLFQFGSQKASATSTSMAMARATVAAKAAAAAIGQPNNDNRDDSVLGGGDNTSMASPARRSRRSTFSLSSPSSSASVSSKRSLFGAVMQKFGPASSSLEEDDVVVGGVANHIERGVEDLSTLSTPTKSKPSTTTAVAWSSGQRLDFAAAAAVTHTQDAHSNLSATGTSTPSRSTAAASASAAAGWMVSPRGNSIMNIVNRMVLNSPFKFQSPAKKRRRTNSTSLRHKNPTTASPASASASPSIATTPQQRNVKRRRLALDFDDATATTTTTTPQKKKSPASPWTPTTPRSRRRCNTPQDEADDWHETSLVVPKSSSSISEKDTTDSFCGMSLLDWSLKHQVRLECQPACCLLDLLSPSEAPAASSSYPQWEASLTYWQHPAARLPPSILFMLEQQRQQQVQEEQDRKAAAANTQTTLFGTKQAPQQQQEPLAIKSKRLERTWSTASSTSSRLSFLRTGSLNSNHGSSIHKQRQPQITDPKANKTNSHIQDDYPSSSSKRYQELAGRLIRAVKGPNASQGRAAWKQGNGNHHDFLDRGVTSFLDQRQRDWQKALKSVYEKWQSQWEQIVVSSTLQEQDWMDCYFYCHAHDHVVLFRLAQDMEGNTIVPQLLLSNGTPALARKLQQLGIDSIHHLNPTLVSGKPEEPDSSHKEWGSPSAREKKTQKDDMGRSPMSPTLVQAELEALRQAQVNGFIAGADVSVKLKPKYNNNNQDTNGKKSDQQKFTGPLLLNGMDNIALFLEIYLNTSGGILAWAQEEDSERAQQKKQPSTMAASTATTRTNKGEAAVAASPAHDLPLILCRALGPFTNAALKSLAVFPCPSSTSADDSASLQDENDPGTNNAPGTAATSSSYAAIEIEGAPIILPCAIRAMVGVLTTSLVAHYNHCRGDDDNQEEKIDVASETHRPSGPTTKAPDSADPHGHSNNNKEESESPDAVGSHHMIFHLSTERPTLMSSTTTGSSAPSTDPTAVWNGTSPWLNHESNHGRKEGGSNSSSTTSTTAAVDECRGGKVVPLMVWDVTRKDMIAYQAAKPLPQSLAMLEKNRAKR